MTIVTSMKNNNILITILTTLLLPFIFPPDISAQTGCTTTISSGNSIQAAFNAASAGSTICLNGGTYREKLELTKSGTAGNHITIRSTNPSQRATIDCTNCNIAAWRAVVWVTGSYITLQDINIQNSSNFNASGGLESVQGLTAVKGTDLKMLNVNMSNIVNYCILTDHYNNVTIDGGEYFNCSMENHPTVKAAHPEWDKNYGSAFSIAHASNNITVRNIKLHDTWGEGINFWSGATNGLAENNIIYNIWGPHLYIDRGSYTTLRNNIVYIRTMSDGVTGRPIEIMNEDEPLVSQYAKMTGNKVYNNILINDPNNNKRVAR